MFKFDPRDEGFLVHDENGRAVASVQTTDVVRDERLKDPKDEKRSRARDKWEIHFTGVKFTPATLKAFMAEVDAIK